MKILLLCALILATNAPAISAELKATDNDNCAWRIDGTLAEGDADRAISLLTRASNMEEVPASDGGRLIYSYFGTRFGVVCLSSPGGSFSEGVALMRFFKEAEWGTFVDDGDSCLSACAIAFMGGTSPHYDGETRLFRTLHVGGQLVFDFPGVAGTLLDGSSNYSEGDISRAIAGIIREFSGEVLGEKTPYFHPDLLVSLFSLGDQDTFPIGSVMQAAAYRVALAGLPELTSSMSGNNYRNICNNLVVRAFGLKSLGRDDFPMNESAFFKDGHIREQFVRLDDGALFPQAELKSVYELDGSTDTCVIGPFYSTFVSGRFGSSSYADISIDRGGSELFFSFDPDTSLSQLAGIATAPEESVETVDTRGVGVSSYWHHNGSVMALLKGGEPGANFRAFVYAEPRASLQGVGVDVGSILFAGTTPDGSSYRGQARTYSCGTRLYEVTGFVSEDGRRIELKGKAVRFDKLCNPVGFRDDILVFDFLGSARDPRFVGKETSLFGSIVPVRVSPHGAT